MTRYDFNGNAYHLDSCSATVCRIRSRDNLHRFSGTDGKSCLQASRKPLALTANRLRDLA